jgi:transcriptional regulator with XRE-family HTH domain
MSRETDKKHIGGLIRFLRKGTGLSQMKLAEKVGVSYQQIQKYERGGSEISMTRLLQIAEALNIPLSRFIPHDEDMKVSESVELYGSLSEDEIELLKFFREIKNKRVKDGLLMAIKGISELSDRRQ